MNYGDSRPSQFAVTFFFCSVLVFCCAGAILYLIQSIWPSAPGHAAPSIPIAIYLSTASLFISSLLIQRALRAVQREKQILFRRSLIGAVVTGTLFISLQGYGLSCLLAQNDPARIVTGALAFAIVCAVLHGLHVTIAMLFLVYVTLLSCVSRYDHEYYWGVLYCSCFWHTLGIIWIIIFFVFLIIT